MLQAAVEFLGKLKKKNESLVLTPVSSQTAQSWSYDLMGFERLLQEWFLDPSSEVMELKLVPGFVLFRAPWLA